MSALALSHCSLGGEGWGIGDLWGGWRIIFCGVAIRKLYRRKVKASAVALAFVVFLVS